MLCAATAGGLAVLRVRCVDRVTPDSGARGRSARRGSSQPLPRFTPGAATSRDRPKVGKHPFSAVWMGAVGLVEDRENTGPRAV